MYESQRAKTLIRRPPPTRSRTRQIRAGDGKILKSLACSALLAGLSLAFAHPVSAEDLSLPALPPVPTTGGNDWSFWTQPHLFGDWGGLRSRLSNLGVDVNL